MTFTGYQSIKWYGFISILLISLLCLPCSAWTGSLTSTDSSSLYDSTKSWTPDELIGMNITMTSGTLSGQSFLILDNSETSVTIKNYDNDGIILDEGYETAGTSLTYQSPITEWGKWFKEDNTGYYSFGGGYDGSYSTCLGSTTTVCWGRTIRQKVNFTGIDRIYFYMYTSQACPPVYAWTTTGGYGYSTVVPADSQWHLVYIDLVPNSKQVCEFGFRSDGAPRAIYIDHIMLNVMTPEEMGFETGDTYYILGGNPPNLDLSATGTFCLAHPINFTLQDLDDTDRFGLYTISGFFENTQPSDWSHIDMLYGPCTYSRSLQPGNWSIHGSIQFDQNCFDTWLNFSIASDCTNAFNGTINSSSFPYNPWDEEGFVWNWNTPFTPYTPTAPTSPNDTFMHDLYESGAISQEQWDQFVESFYAMQNFTASQTNQTTDQQAATDLIGILTELNKAGESTRGNLNASHALLTEYLKPSIHIMGISLAMVPSQIIDLMGVMLVFSLVMLILKGRKD